MSSSNQSVVTLVSAGKALFCLDVTPAQDAESMRRSLAELIEHLRKCLDEPIDWFDRRSGSPGKIRLALQFDVLADLPAEAFSMEVREDAVILLASTLPGLEHAVHYFLEKAFRVRWLWPGSVGTVTPRARQITLPIGTTVHRPSFEWRRLWIGGSWWEESDCYLGEQKHGGVSSETMDELFQWQRRVRLGGLNIADGHRWAEICSPLRYADTHPEYFAMVNGVRDSQLHDGKHGNQPCTSNPEVVGVVADYIKAQFRARPELDAFSIACNDGSGFCECEACRAIDEWAQSEGHTKSEFDALTAEGSAGAARSRVLTDRMVLFANQIAERVAQEFPNKLLLMLIYSFYRSPPKRAKLHENVIAQFCSMTFSHTEPAVFDAEMQSFEQLARNASRLGIYDYFVNGKNGTLPRGFARTAGRSLKRYHAEGARYFATQAGLDFALGGFNYYYTARQLWEIDADVDAVLNDYCRAGFANAAAVVERYLAAFLDRWETLWSTLPKPKPTVELLAGILYPEDWRAARREDLKAAMRLIEGDAASAARVRFLIEGLDFLDLLVPACEAACQAFAITTTKPDAIGHATATRERLLTWVNQHRDGFWISAAWFDYQRLTRSGLLGRVLPT